MSAISKTAEAKEAQNYVKQLVDTNQEIAERVMHLDIALWCRKFTDILDHKLEIQQSYIHKWQAEKLAALQLSDSLAVKRPADGQIVVDPRLEQIMQYPKELDELVEYLQPLNFRLSRSISALRLALQAAMPGASEGTPFDTGVQEEVVTELNRMEEALCTIGGVDGIGEDKSVDVEKENVVVLDGIGGAIASIKFRSHRAEKIAELAKTCVFKNPGTDSKNSPYASLPPFIPGVSLELNTPLFENIVRCDARELVRVRMFVLNVRDNLIILRELLRKNAKHLLQDEKHGSHGSTIGMY